MADTKTGKGSNDSSVAERLAALKKSAGPDVVGDASAKLNDTVAALKSGATPDALRQAALDHGGEHAKKLLAATDQARALANGNLDLKQLANTAETMGVDGKTKEFLQHLSNNADPSKAGEIPGMVYDKESGTVKLFGISGLEVPAQMAAFAATGYSLFLNVANGWVWDKGYKLGQHYLGEGFNLDQAMRHRAGVGLAYAGIATMTHWPDISQFIQSEQKYRDDYTQLARQIAPLLDEMKGGHGAAALMSVKQEENEVIYNERRRMHSLNGAERIKHFVQAAGRAVQFVVSAIEGHDRLGAHGFSASVVAKAAKDGKDGLDKYLDEYRSAYDQIKSKVGDAMTKESIEDLVRQRMGQAPKSKDGQGHISDAASKFMNGGSVAATFAAQTLGNAMYSQKMASIQPVSAFDMILELKKQLDDDPKLERYSLPKGMHLDVQKGADANSLPLRDYIVQIFQQHERDCDPNNKIGKRLTEKLERVADDIAKALSSGELDGMALIKLVGERKIVKHGGKSICTDDALTKELEHLKAKMRHVAFVDEKEYFNDANFSRKQLKDAWDAMKDDERNVFMNFVPLEVLEAAGIHGGDLKARRDAAMKRLHEDYSKAISAVLELGEDKLQMLDATPSEIATLRKADEAMKEDGADAIRDYLPGPGNKNATVDRPLVNLLVHHIQHGGKLAELLQRGVAD